MKQSRLTPHFVEFIPEQLSEGILYVSEKFGTAVHLCCCGCQEQVVTPLSPVDWQLRKVGGSVSLYPSIGNWSFACKSHYWIFGNRVEWAPAMSKQQIARIGRLDKRAKARYIAEINASKPTSFSNEGDVVERPEHAPRGSAWAQLKLTLKGWFGR